MAEKARVVQRIDNNVAYSQICQEFKIGKSTVAGINKRSDEILNHINQNGNSNVKRLRFTETGKEIDSRVFERFCAAR